MLWSCSFPDLYIVAMEPYAELTDMVSTYAKPCGVTSSALAQRLLRHLEELSGRYTGKVGHNLTNNTLISFEVVRV